MSTELDKAREALTGEERLTIALSGIPDDIAPNLEAKRGTWNVCSYVLVQMLDGLGDLAPNRFSYVFSYDDSERYEIEVHRVRGESQLDALAKSNAALERALEAVDRLTAALADAEATIANERAQVAELQRLGASIHKAADAAREAERADVVAWLRAGEWPTGSTWQAIKNCIDQSANAIERGAHEGAVTKEQG